MTSSLTRSLSIAASALIASIAIGSLFAANLSAEQRIQPPNRKKIFAADRKDTIKAQKKTTKRVLARDAAPTQDIDIQAPSVEYGKSSQEVIAKGGVVVSGPGATAQADSVRANLQTKDAQLEGSVVVSAAQGEIVAQSGSMNMDSELGKFTCSKLTMNDGNYRIAAGEIEKLSDDEFEIRNSKLTTCDCADAGKDGSASCSALGEQQPWAIHSDRVHITRNGYAHTYGSWIDVGGVPIIYTPYLGFPVKEERQSGLLVPELGYSRQDGFLAKVPMFVVLDDSSDLLISPFTESKTRNGFTFDYRQAFSRNNQVESRVMYSDETPRDGDLRGTRVDDIFDRKIDDNRFAGFYRQIWRAAPDAELPLTMVADLHYVSDDLINREIIDEDIAESTARYVTSTAVVRSNVGEIGTAELSGEFNQAVTTDDDDRVLQRLPEGQLSLLKSFRPFGMNPYGAKLVTRMQGLATVFDRDEGFDGTRLHWAPSVSLPFHYRNYLEGSLTSTLYRTDYWLRDDVIAGTDQSYDDRSSRTLPSFSYTMSTGLERVFDVERGGFFDTVTALGADNQRSRLVRVKNTIEPFTRFTYTPDRDQNSNAFFDSLDRIRRRQVMTYGVRSSLYGRFDPASGSTGISELAAVAPENTDSDVPRDGVLRRAEVRELASLVLRQSYDAIEARENNNDSRNAFSDLGADLYLYPNASFGLGLESNYNTENGIFSSWAVASQLKSDRGDALRARWTFTRSASDPSEVAVSQFEGSGEVKVTDRVRFGAYSRIDERTGTSLQSEGRVRFLSSCDCWHLDLGYGQRANPDDRQLLLTFTFSGLGDISQGIRLNSSGSAN